MAALNEEFFSEWQPKNLDLFSLDPTQTAVEKIFYQQVRPINQLTPFSPVEFVIGGNNGLQYVDLKKSYLSLKLRIVHGDTGTKLTSTQYVGPVNLIAHSLFEQVDVSLQGKLISTGTTHYPYRSYIQKLLEYGNDYKSSQMSTQLWKKDTAQDSDDPKTGDPALVARAKHFLMSNQVHLLTDICHDLFKIDRYILNQVEIGLKFYRSKPSFYLMCDLVGPNFRIDIDEMVFNVCKVQLNSAVLYAHNQMLQKTAAKYPYKAAEIRMTAIPQGQVSFTIDNVCQGKIPQRLIIGFVNSKAVAGDYTLSPYNFNGYNLNQINVYLDGQPVLGNSVKTNFGVTAGGLDTVEPFFWMLNSYGKWLEDKGNQLTVAEIAKGFALYVFDLEPAFAEKTHLHLLKQGIVRVEANFGKPLPHPVTCIVMTQNLNYFEINLAREVIVYK